MMAYCFTFLIIRGKTFDITYTIKISLDTVFQCTITTVLPVCEIKSRTMIHMLSFACHLNSQLFFFLMNVQIGHEIYFSFTSLSAFIAVNNTTWSMQMYFN